MTRDKLKERLRGFGVWDLFVHRREIRSLCAILVEDETILGATTGAWKGRRWVVIATTRRWVFAHTGLVGGGEYFEEPLRHITDWGAKKGWFFGQLRIRGGRGEIVLRNVPKRTLERMARAVEEGKLSLPAEEAGPDGLPPDSKPD